MQRLRIAACSGATAVLAACAAQPPAAPRPHYDFARAAAAAGDDAAAGREVKLALQDDPLDARSHFLEGCLLARHGAADQAAVGFQRTASLDPANADAAYNVGTILLARGENVAAADWLERAATIRPDHVPTYDNLAKAYFMAGMPELAFATYEEALRRDPSNAVALRSLAILGDAAGLHDEADGYRRRLEELGLSAAAVPGADGAHAAPRPADGGAAPPKEEKAAPAPPPPAEPEPPARTQADVSGLREILRDLKHVTIEQRADLIAVCGWTSGPKERAILDRVIGGRADIVDLTTDDSGDPQHMIEVDAVLFVVRGLESESTGFNFLRLVNINAKFFASDHANPGTGFTAPGTTGIVSGMSQQGWIASAAVDYDVNIANAADTRVAVLARPHLTTLSGTPARFLVGGEYVFKVSGLESGDIKLYPFGVTLTVTPTLLRSPGEDGRPRVHLAVDAGRTSVLNIITSTDPNATVVFDKLDVSSQAVLGIDQTLILSGLNQKETDTDRSGVPILSSIPLIKYLFSQETTVESTAAVIILLTPRDPAYVDESNRAAVEKFVEMRRAFVEARRGTPEDFKRFTQKYPDWRRIPPNRFASHFFLMNNSEVYRAVSGQDLSHDDVELGILGKRADK
jgi:Tfp pilus assembly protein PilF